MAWIIASVPFWTIGAFLFGMGSWALSHGIQHRNSMSFSDFNSGMVGSLAFILAAGIFWLLAAMLVH